MRNPSPVATIVLAAFTLCLPAAAKSRTLLHSLQLENIDSMQINLNPGGAEIGFKAVFDGGDPRLESLVALLRDAKPGGGHKCSNAGAVRFLMKDGSTVGVGLLPSHTEGLYGFRLYDGDRFLEPFIVDREDLLAAMGELGVPTSDPAFRE